ncbi:hypothetical protein [Erythrobacter sp. HKB08]|uniref:hypothetical protein n=1 Tax=Erythrobacter sp. HKB08 TaxID=2502843 RepID=UPI0010092C51|nr:hypothetical protein [Erythrobacter sp. HKB08]
MRSLAALLLAFGLVLPAAAQDEQEKPSWVGVWEGTIGRYPVVVCLDQRRNGDGQGSYYYLSQLKPIRLESRESIDSWIEGSSYSEDGSQDPPRWAIASVSHDRIGGSWHQGERNLPIALTRIPEGAEESWFACESRNYLEPRSFAPDFETSADSIEGLDFARMTFLPPAHLEDVHVGGFSFAPSQPGDPAILDWLAARLPSGKVEDDVMQCMAGAISLHGVDGYFERSHSPVFANGQLLSLVSGNSSYCGGAHPNHWQEYFTFDRQSGEQLDPADWFVAEGIARGEYGGVLMQPALRAIVMQRWPDEETDNRECAGFASDHEWWSYLVERDGIRFQPDLAHAITPCEYEVSVPWGELEPVLSEGGKALRQRAER